MENILTINEKIKNIKKDINLFNNILKERESKFTKNQIYEYNTLLNIYKNKLRNINGGKNININEYGSCDERVMVVTFPIGTSKQFKRNWLIKNSFPTHDKFFNRNSCIYDCSGELVSIYVNYKQHKVIITNIYDM